MKQDSISSKLPFYYLRNGHMSVNKLEKHPCIVSIVDISKWLDFDNQDLEQTTFENRTWLIVYSRMFADVCFLAI